VVPYGYSAAVNTIGEDAGTKLVQYKGEVDQLKEQLAALHSEDKEKIAQVRRRVSREY
jgi:hypothetical protein